MNRWSDKVIKQHVEELIEESYILSLTDDEMRRYFRNFIEACDHVLRSKVSIHDDLKIVRIKMALLKARLLIDNNAVCVMKQNISEIEALSRHKLFAQQIISTKRAIIKFFENFDPHIAHTVLEEAMTRKNQKKKDMVRRKSISSFIVAAGYYVLFVGTLTLILFVGFH
jgi:hypothetical protein